MADTAREGSLGVNPLTVFLLHSSVCVQRQLTRQLGNHGVDASKSFHILFFLSLQPEGVYNMYVQTATLPLSRGGQMSVMS